nr:unnamed protein product [Digitaria exilis]
MEGSRFGSSMSASRSAARSSSSTFPRTPGGRRPWQLLVQAHLVVGVAVEREHGVVVVVLVVDVMDGELAVVVVAAGVLSASWTAWRRRAQQRGTSELAILLGLTKSSLRCSTSAPSSPPLSLLLFSASIRWLRHGAGGGSSAGD